MPDVYYHCHNCGSIHEAEDIRLNLHLAGNPLEVTCLEDGRDRNPLPSGDNLMNMALGGTPR